MADDKAADAAQLLDQWKSLTDWLTSEHRDFRDQLDRAERLRGESRGRFMVLGAGIVGIVIPLLAKGPILASTSLARAAMCFLGAIAFSAVAEIVLRFFAKSMRDTFAKSTDASYQLQAALVMRLMDPSRPEDSQLKELVDKTHQRFARVGKVREVFRTIDDLGFYGLFLAGLWNLRTAFM